MTNLEWALACAARGWLVFPSQAKKPLIKWGKYSSTDPAVIAEWWRHWPDADVCIKTGAESNLIVIDWDSYKTPKNEYGLGPSWPLSHWVDTYLAKTPKGGLHAYYTHPGYPVANSAGLLAPHVDLRGDGGMVVAYRPIRDAALAPAPAEWCKERRTVTVQLAPVSPPFEGEGDGMTLAVSMLEKYAADVLEAEAGTLNTTLWMKASDAFKMVAAGELREQSVIDLLYSVAVQAGHPAEGARNTIHSARNRGLLEPTSCVDMYWKEKGRA